MTGGRRFLEAVAFGQGGKAICDFTRNAEYDLYKYPIENHACLQATRALSLA